MPLLTYIRDNTHHNTSRYVTPLLLMIYCMDSRQAIQSDYR